jgi:hypothetical protein
MTDIIERRQAQVELIKEGYAKLRIDNEQVERIQLPAFNKLVGLINKGTISNRGEIAVPAPFPLTSPPSTRSVMETTSESDLLSAEERVLPEETRMLRDPEEVTKSTMAPSSLIDFSSSLKKIVPVEAFSIP